MADILPIKPTENISFDALEALETLPFSTFILSAEGVVIFANIAAQQFFLASSRLLIKKGIRGIISDYEAFENHIAHVVADNNSLTLHQISVELPHMQQALVDITLSPFKNMNEMRILLTIERVSKIEDNNEGTKQVASLADMLAHEVKNPLSGIRGAAQLLEQNASLEDKNLTQIICNECDRIKGLVESMERFSVDESLELKAENIHNILDHVCAVAGAGFADNINIKTVYDPSLPLVSANRDALVQLLLNLVKNAAESIDKTLHSERGEIIIKTAFQHRGISPAITKPAIVQKPTPIEITISDNGNGISEDMLDNLFEPFVTSKKVGKGLGLALGKKIVNAHGGHIIAENTANGAQFKLYLTVASKGKTQ